MKSILLNLIKKKLFILINNIFKKRINYFAFYIFLYIQVFSFSLYSVSQNTKELIDQKKNNRSIILKNVTIIVGKNNRVLKNKTLIIKNGLIDNIISADKKLFLKNNIEYDLKDKYIIPGLIESHSHTMPFSSEEAYTNALYHGITTIRDMGGDGSYLKDLKNAIKSGEVIAPDIYFSAIVGGEDLILKDSRIRMSTPENFKLGEAPWARLITDKTNVFNVISDAKKCGAKGIKVYSHLSAELVQKISIEARKQKIKVWCHALVGPANVEDVVNSGVDSISHITFLLFPPNWNLKKHGTLTFDKGQMENKRLNKLFKTMKKNGTFLDPTIIIAMRDVDNKIKNESEKQVKKNMIISVLKKAYKSGVDFVAGTDVFLPKKKGTVPELHLEIELLVNVVGMTPLKAIEAATFNGAKLLGIEKTHGTVEIGKTANLVVLNNSPLENIKNTSKIEFVIKNGKIYERK